MIIELHVFSGNGIRWAVKRKIMSQFFAKTNMKELFNSCKTHMEGPILEKWRENIKTGTEIDLHDELAVTFQSYLQVFGLQDFYSPEVVADNVSKILEAIPKPLFDRYQYFFSQDKVCSLYPIQITLCLDIRGRVEGLKSVKLIKLEEFDVVIDSTNYFQTTNTKRFLYSQAIMIAQAIAPSGIFPGTPQKKKPS